MREQISQMGGFMDMLLNIGAANEEHLYDRAANLLKS